MSRVKQIIATTIITLIVLVSGTVYWVYSSLDRMVKGAIETYGPQFMQVAIKLDKAKISPREGKGALYRLFIGNPPEFKSPHALRVETIDLNLDVGSLMQDVIVIHKLEIVSPDVLYDARSKASNFDVIQRNVERVMKSETRKRSARSSKKIIIEQLMIKEAKVTYYSPLTQMREINLSLPDITINNIGKAKGGATASEVTQSIVQALQASVVKNVVKNIDPEKMVRDVKAIDVKKLDPQKLFK